MARIGGCVDRAGSGRGGVLVIAGASGIGKTRLVAEAVTLARGRGFTVVSGAGRIFGGRQAYAVWLEALGSHLARLPGPEQARLVDGLPDLGRLFLGLHLPAPVPLLDAGLERTRLFEAVARLLARLAGRSPLLVALDDLQWLDPVSVELLHYVARGISDRPILLVTSYRTDEVEDAPEVLALVRDLRRAGPLDEVVLTGLDAVAIRSLAAALLDGEPPDAFVDNVTARTVGSPLMIAALIDELRMTGGLFRSGGAWVVGPGALDVVPAVVGDLVRGRLRRLTAAQRTLLELVVVAGDAASVPVLAGALSAAEEAVLETARELADLAVLNEATGPDGVRFRTVHPAYAEVAYGELPESVRRRRHAAVAAALESRCPDRIDLLAPHCLGGADLVDRGRALEVLAAAGERALAVHAGAEAAGYLAAAHRLAAAGGDRDRVTVLAERLGDAWHVAGRYDTAVEAWAEALTGYRTARDGESIARVGRALAVALWEQGRFAAARRLLDEILAAEPTGSGAELLLAHQTGLRLLMRAGEIGTLEAGTGRLRELGDRLGSHRAVAMADGLRALAHQQRGEYVRARRLLLDVRAMKDRIDDPALGNWVERPLAIMELGLAGPGPALRRFRAVAEEARTMAVLDLEVSPRLLVTLGEFLAGDWDGAWRTATGLLGLGHRIASARGVAAGLAGRALVLCHRGELAAAAQCVAEARSAFGGGRPVDRYVFSVLDTVEAMVGLHREPDVAARGPAGPPPDDLPPGGLLIPELHLAVLGEVRLAAGAPDVALRIAERLAGFGPDAAYPGALADRLVGLVRRAGGDRAAAGVAFERAAGRFGELGMPFEAARCRLERASAVGAEHPAAAVDDLQAALRLFARLGARRYADRARRRLRELGAQPVPVRRPVAGGLSEREAEVVRLVAEGLANADIARRLVISPRTVTTHLQHVYARLGIGSRAALVRYAMDHDLAGPAVRTVRPPDT
jgi:DNA-binding CsgD family transcriptional regulator